MYLKELNIFGFKSFPDRTFLKFNSGITAVVGPNGCGKSNIFDAIKWVLGEQKPKSLRGTKMEDVIFNGTETHSALNYAEVSLIFSNEDRYLPINYSEVSIGRRLHRSGESQYFINKSPVRLKDVQDLFLGTGIGETTYSFVEQGKIEALLSYKPEDKRLIFDEASGIVKYKERKRETLRRLSEADDNILRLDDILAEVRRQINYLERQAAKAEKYKKTKEKLVEIEKSIAAGKNKELDLKISAAASELESAEKKEKEIRGRLSLLNNSLGQLNASRDSCRESLEQVNTLIISTQAQSRTHKNSIDFSSQRAAELKERNKELGFSRQSLEEKINLQSRRGKEEKKRLAAIEEEIFRLEKEKEALLKAKEEAGQKMRQAEQFLKEEKSGILDLENKKARAHNSAIELQAQLVTLTSRKKRLVLDKAKLENLLSENREKFSKAEADFKQVSLHLESLKEKKQGLAAKGKEINQKKENHKNLLTQREKNFFELNASFQFLKDFRTQYQTFSRTEDITVVFEKDPGDINKLVASLQNKEFAREGGVFKARIQAKVIAFKEEQLLEKIKAGKDEISRLKKELEGWDRQEQALANQLSSEDGRIESYSASFNQVRQECDSLARELKRLEEERELVDEEAGGAAADIEELEGKRVAAEKEKEELTERLDKLNYSLESRQETIQSCQEELRGNDIQGAQLLAQRDSLLKEKASISSKLDFFQEETESIQRDMARAEKERESNCQQIASLEAKVKELKEQIEKDKQSIENSLIKKEELRQKEASLSREASGQSGQAEELKKELSGLQQNVYNRKLKVQGLEYEKEKIRDYLKQVYDLEINLAGLELSAEPPEKLKEEKEKLQKRINSLGEVNLVAIEEFQELKERRDFLEGQRLDLVTSKENLKKAINKINRTSREIFLEVFEKIEKEFKKNYKFLFNGGRARLILLDPGDVLESGVEIEVQPPGKKLQNVSLLSGGEKALTAIALIFSIFTVKPSPLCVLDEIDAPLDEANVGRFNFMLKDFSRNAQFILITHNKKTMSNADVLYGVTMQQKGVSNLVSVKFAEEKTKT